MPVVPIDQPSFPEASVANEALASGRLRGEQALHADAAASWRADAEAWFAALARETRLCADDLVDACGRPAEGPAANNAIGGFFSALQRKGLIEFVIFVRSKRPEGHGNRIALWRKAI